MKIKKIMSRALVTVEFEDPLHVVNHIFENTRFHHLLVIENKKLYGIISDRDLLKALSPNLNTLAETEKDRSCLNKKAHQIMTSNILTLTPEDNVQSAISLLLDKNISCIPIVDKEQVPQGILSWRDVLSVISQASKEQAPST